MKELRLVAPLRYLLFRLGELTAEVRTGALTLGVQAAVLLVAVLLVVGLPGNGEASGASRKPIEVASLRNANSNTVVNADGTFTTSVFAQPVNFRDSDGHWRPIEAKFAKSSRNGFEWQSGANSFHADFKQQADSAFLRFDPGRGSPFTLALDGAKPSVGAKQTENDLLFRNVVQLTDLTYALLPQGLKESLILHNANAGPDFTFTLAPTDKSAELRAVKQDDGTYAFYQGGGEPVFTLQAPIVRDSANGKPPKGWTRRSL